MQVHSYKYLCSRVCVISVVWSVWVHGCFYDFSFVDWSRFYFWAL